jgi:hypothetical protein
VPVIPATWEAEIRRTVVLGQSEQKVQKIPSQQKKLSMVIPAMLGSINRRVVIQVCPGKE